MRYLIALVAFRLSVATAWSAPAPPITALDYHPSGSFLAVGVYGKILLIDPNTGELSRELDGQTKRVTALAYSPKGERLAVASGEPGKSGVIRIYQVSRDNVSLLTSLPDAHSDIIYALTFAPDGQLLASAGYDRTIKLWDASASTPPRLLADHSDAIYGLSFHRDGKLLASASADRAVKVWDAASGKRLYTLGESTDGVYTIMWSPDGKYLAAAGSDKSIRIWAADANGGKLVHSVFAHTQPVTRIAYSRDGKALFSIGEGPNIKRWDAATMKEKLVFPPQSETMQCLALSPDQKQIAVGRFDGALVLLDAATGKTISQPLPAKPKPPELRKLSPDFGLRGTSARLAIDGRFIADVEQVVATHPEVKTRIVAEGRTPNRLEVEVDIPATTPVGVISFSLKSPSGTSSSLPFAVDRYPVVKEAGPKDSPRIGMMVKIPATLVGSIGKAGDADYYRFHGKAGQEIAVQVTPTGSNLEPILELTDALGRPLVESSDGLLGFKCATDGIYSLGVRDKEFRGGPNFPYRLSIGSFPLVTGVTPLSVERGKEATLHLQGVNLPVHDLRFTAPANAKPGSRVPLTIPSASEEMTGEAKVLIGEFPEHQVVDGRATIAVPGTANGVVEKPGAFQIVEFEAKKGQRLIVEIEASRLNSPLDSAIEITDTRDSPVPQATLRSISRTFTTFRDNDSATSGIRLEAWSDLAIDDYLYADGELMRINQLPKNPDDDCQFYQTGGQRSAFLGTTTTHHAMGSPLYKVEIHPPGATFPPNGLPLFNLAYRNDDGGPGFGKDSRIFFDAPADGRYRVRIRDARNQGSERHAYRLTIRPPRPDFSISFKPTAPAVWKGGSVPINVTANRLDGFDGPIQVALQGLPAGFEAPPTFIEAGQSTTSFPLYAAATAAVAKETSWKMVARAVIDGKEIIHEEIGGQISVLDSADIVTTTDMSAISLKPGESAKIRVDVERRNGFAGRIPIDVRGLPHGVRVLNIGLNGILITERETRREIVLYAEPWVQPMERPLIVLCTREGKKTEHGAQAVILRVSR